MRWPWQQEKAAADVTVEYPRDAIYSTQGDALAAQVQQAVIWAMQLGPEGVWNTQPYVRTVVTFLARNIAQLGLHVFTRVSDTERNRVQDDALARTIRRPNPSTTTYELIFGLVADKALYDRAYWLIGPGQNGAKTITRLPPARVVSHVASDPLGSIDAFRVQTAKGMPIDVPASRVLYFPGWNPSTALGLPSSPLDAIKSVISEQAAAFEFRRLAWANGLQSSQVIERPAGAIWKEEQRNQFVEDVRAQFSGDGPRRNGVLLLEDGMSLKGEQFSAREAQWIDAAKLSLALVAAIYHVNPTMVGLLDNANYSNVVEFRKMLYGDTLGPIIASIEDRLNAFLVPLFGDESEYVEFNIAEKLQGNFEEQASAMQTAVGAPWMLRSEARALLNLPPIEGADELITPLNVGMGAAPESASSPPAAPAAAAAPQAASRASVPHAVREAAARPGLALVRSKATVDEQQQQQVADVLVEFFGRQEAAVMSRIGAGVDDFWNQRRWDESLSRDLQAVATALTSTIGPAEAKRLGYGASDFDVEQTVAYIGEVAQRYAGNVNATTKTQLDETLASDEPDAAGVFDIAKTSRAAGIAVGFTTFVGGFATREAAHQIAQQHDVEPTKTWITGANPRPSHAQMNGETVPIDQPFSNGMQWPAESGDVDEVAGCNCSIEVTIG